MAYWRHCAIGHAARDPWFQAQGLRRVRCGEVRIDGRPVDGAAGFSAVSRFFGLSQSDAQHLFTGRSTPKRVALRIERLTSGLPV